MKTRPYTLITGASSGIGYELARIAAENGHNLVLVARDEAKLHDIALKLREQHSVQCEVFTFDLSHPNSAETLVSQLEKKNLPIDILINNAGFGDYGVFSDSDLETQLAMIDLNIRTLTELTHRLLPSMVKRKHGRIMNLASIAAFLPGPLMSVYFASKAYVLSFSEALSEELRGSGVTVTCLCPGSTKTAFGESAHVSASHSTRTSSITARSVAEFGWRAMMLGKAVAVHRFNNRLSLWAIHLFPRSVVRRIVHSIQK